MTISKNRIAISFGNKPYYGSLKVLERTYSQFNIPFKRYTGEWFIETEVGQMVVSTLINKRGFYYWCWKPFIILDALKEYKEVLYTDANVYCISDPSPLFDLLKKRSIVVFEHGNKNLINQTWTKHDTFRIMGLKTEEYYKGVQLTATFSLWNRGSIDFLNEWLKYCLMPEVVSDMPNSDMADNLPGFKDHRHDQSILSLLSQKHNLDRFRDPSQWGNIDNKENSKYDQIFNHHRLLL